MAERTPTVQADEAGSRARLVRRARYLLFKATHRGSEPWRALASSTARHARLGASRRCKVCGLSIRGPLGWVNRSVWGIAPLSKHPDLCNVCKIGERLLEVTVVFADAQGFTRFAEGRPPDEVPA